MDLGLDLLNLLKGLGGSGAGMEGFAPMSTDLANVTQQNARSWVGVKPINAREGTVPLKRPISYANPRVFDGDNGFKQIGGPLLGLMTILLPAVLGKNPWADVAAQAESQEAERLRGQLGWQPANFWQAYDRRGT